MFELAVSRASAFTHPVIASLRFASGDTRALAGSMVILNREGWVATAAHHFEPHYVAQQHALARKALPAGQKPDPNSLVELGMWFGADRTNLKDVRFVNELDLAIGRLDPFTPDAIATYPTLRDPASLPLGTPLVTVGFANDELPVAHDPVHGFSFPPGLLPLGRYPLAGIHTRSVMTGSATLGLASGDVTVPVKFLETSAPMLRGQAGGAVLDATGALWGIAVRCLPLPLGTTVKTNINNLEIEQPRFIDVGWAVHPEALFEVLRAMGVPMPLAS